MGDRIRRKAKVMIVRKVVMEMASCVFTRTQGRHPKVCSCIVHLTKGRRFQSDLSVTLCGQKLERNRF